MSWEIVVGISVLVGLVATFVGAAWKLASSIAELNVAITNLQNSFSEMREDSKTSHTKIYNKLDDHERRITTVEAKIDGQ